MPGCVLLLLVGALGAESSTDWSAWKLEQQVGAVSDSELHLLPEGVPDAVHLHRNDIRLGAESLEDGWVLLDQCHEQMDAVPELQVTYYPERVRIPWPNPASM